FQNFHLSQVPQSCQIPQDKQINSSQDQVAEGCSVINASSQTYQAVSFDKSSDGKKAIENELDNIDDHDVWIDHYKKPSKFLKSTWKFTSTLLKAQRVLLLILALQKKLDQLPAVDMQHASAKLPFKLHMFAYVKCLAQSLCSLHSDCESKLG
ncbi:hypothetical protein VP01_8373g1, partial [Puccinia sorghi]